MTTEQEEEEERITQERRKIRGKQRELQEDLHQVKAQLNNVESDKFQTMRGRLNDIFVDVHHPREQQNDALTFKALSMAAKEQSSNMSDSAYRFDFTVLAANISAKYSRDESFSWSKFGKDVGHINNNAPSFSTMLGPISKEVKVRKVAVRKEKESMNMTAEKPEDISQDDKDGDEATNERLKVLHKLIMKEMPSDGDEQHEQLPFDLLKLLVDPADNVQTIENFFDFSFLIKDKMVLQDISKENGRPMAFGIDQNKLNNSGLCTDKRQMILSINMQDLAAFSKLLYPSYQSNGSGENNTLHRSDPLYDAADAGEQADIIQRTQQAKSDERRRMSRTNAGPGSSTSSSAKAGTFSSRRASSQSTVAKGVQMSFTDRKTQRDDGEDEGRSPTTTVSSNSSRQDETASSGIVKRSRIH